MGKVWLVGSLMLLLGSAAFSQKAHVGLFGGLSTYEGDLVDKVFPKKLPMELLG